jgi:hypothetical protein
LNYLQLCQALRAESGLSGTGPSSVVGQSGMYARLVEWTQEAYAEILDMLPWSFLWARATPTLTIGQTIYTPAQLGVADLGRIWAKSVLDTTAAPPVLLRCYPWQTLDSMYWSGRQGPPRYFARRPDNTIQILPEPDLAYTLQLDYQRIAPALTANTDTPLIPDANLHKAIVYKALEYYGMHDENVTAMQHGARQFAVMLSRMDTLYGQPIQTATAPVDQAQPPVLAELV